MRDVVHLGEVADDRLHEPLGAQRGEPVLPEQLGDVPPLGAGFALGEGEDGPVPDAEHVGGLFGPAGSVAGRHEAEFFGCADEVSVDLDEDGCAQLDWLGGVAVHVHGGGAAADVIRCLVDGDVRGLAGGAEAVDVVCCGSTRGSSSCFGRQ